MFMETINSAYQNDFNNAYYGYYAGAPKHYYDYSAGAIDGWLAAQWQHHTDVAILDNDPGLGQKGT